MEGWSPQNTQCGGGGGGVMCRAGRRCGFDPWVGKIPWRRTWQPTPVFLPEKLHGQRSLVGYSPWGRKEPDMTEPLSRHAHTPEMTQTPPAVGRTSRTCPAVTLQHPLATAPPMNLKKQP